MTKSRAGLFKLFVITSSASIIVLFCPTWLMFSWKFQRIERRLLKNAPAVAMLNTFYIEATNKYIYTYYLWIQDINDKSTECNIMYLSP